MKKLLTFTAGLLTCASLMLTAVPASARSDVSVGINLGFPGVYVEPRPIYVEPRPIYVEPRPIYVEPQPVYVQPSPFYIEGGPVYYQRPQWEGRGHRGRRHWKDREYRRHDWDDDDHDRRRGHHEQD
ncbi:MAG: hypothetical protein ABIO19_02835 [Burkholderiaceae bacterium]